MSLTDEVGWSPLITTLVPGAAASRLMRTPGTAVSIWLLALVSSMPLTLMMLSRAVVTEVMPAPPAGGKAKASSAAEPPDPVTVKLLAAPSLPRSTSRDPLLSVTMLAVTPLLVALIASRRPPSELLVESMVTLKLPAEVVMVSDPSPTAELVLA